FSRPSSLVAHSYTHTGEKPFAGDCGADFSVLSNFRQPPAVFACQVKACRGRQDLCRASARLSPRGHRERRQRFASCILRVRGGRQRGRCAGNDLLLASYEYEAGVSEADVLAAINRVAPPYR
ncbi:hypothetical protein BDZ88DRAFT_393542, partial [Geranomyces variabilis]